MTASPSTARAPLPAPPFLQFWAATNAALTRSGYPELRFGAAHRLWDATFRAARHAALVEALDRAAATGT